MYGYPNEAAADVALSVTRDMLEEHSEQVRGSFRIQVSNHKVVTKLVILAAILLYICKEL